MKSDFYFFYNYILLYIYFLFSKLFTMNFIILIINNKKVQLENIWYILTFFIPYGCLYRLFLVGKLCVGRQNVCYWNILLLTFIFDVCCVHGVTLYPFGSCSFSTAVLGDNSYNENLNILALYSNNWRL